MRKVVLTATLLLWVGGCGVSARRLVQDFTNGLGLSGGLLQSGFELHLDSHIKLVKRLHTWQLHDSSTDSNAKAKGLLDEVPAAIKLKMVGAPLGRGAYGEAWRARDEHGNDVVYKFFYRNENDGSVEYLTSETATSRDARIMQQETKACDDVKFIQASAQKGMIQHPGAGHICKCLEYQFNAEAAFIKQEFCGEVNLKTWRESYPSLSAKRRWEMARKMTYQIVTVLSLLADVKYMHHDLKPANVVVSFVDGQDVGQGEPIVKVVDFGALRQYENFDQPCMWTELYAPIELRENQERPCAKEGREYTYDMFAAGAICAELLTGEQLSFKPYIGAVDFDRMKAQSDQFWDAPGSPATKLMEWMTRQSWHHRPHPRAVVLDQALMPWGLSFVIGQWQRPGMDRSFTISATPGGTDFEFTLFVNTKDEERGNQKVTKEDCDHQPRPKMCCNVKVEYSSRSWSKAEAGSHVIEVTFCSMSFWTMTFQESVEKNPHEHPEKLIEDVAEFSRTTAS